MSVYIPGSYDDESGSYETRPCEKTITIKHLLTHTSGLSYGFDTVGFVNKVDLIYSNHLFKGFAEAVAEDASAATGGALGVFCDRLATLPLLFEPGKHWWYGFNTGE